MDFFLWKAYFYISKPWARLVERMYVYGRTTCGLHVCGMHTIWSCWLSNSTRIRTMWWSGSLLFTKTGERGGSVVECRTPEREVRGSRPTSAVLCPWARHFTPRKYWLITQEAMAPSRHDWKIVDWDVKYQHNQPTYLQMLSFFLALYNQMGTIFTLTPLSHRKTKVHCLYIGPRLSSLSTKINWGHWKKKISFCLDKKKTGL